MKKTKYYDTKIICTFRKNKRKHRRAKQFLIEHFDEKHFKTYVDQIN